METPSKTIVADSSGLISLLIATDSNHSAAIKSAEQLTQGGTSVLIAAEILAETINILGKKFGHEQTAQVIEELSQSAAFLVIPTSDIMRKDALARFRVAPPPVSYTDCLVMAVAATHETKEVFGFDQQFEDAGYNRLKSHSPAGSRRRG